MEKKVKAESRIAVIPIILIFKDSSSAERNYSRKELYSLSKSIEKNGILQPIIVRDIKTYEFELISGERRLRAAIMAGLTEIPCIIIHCTRKQAAVYRVVENLQRESGCCFKTSREVKALTDQYGFSKEQAAAQLGVSERIVSEYLSLLSFTQGERRVLERESVALSKMAQIVRIKDKVKRKRAISKVVKGELSEEETRALVSSIKKPSPPIHKLIVKDIRLFYNTIERAVATMKESGIKASLEKRESDEKIEFRIVIQKN